MKNYLFILVIALFSCQSNTTQTKENTINEKPDIVKQHLSIDLQIDNENPLTIGDIIAINYSTSNNKIPDSITLRENIAKKNIVIKTASPILWNSINAKTGTNNLMLTFYYGDSLQASKSISIKLLSDIVPQKFGYKVINKYDHDYKSYTQGLEFSEGFLFEGTGQYGESMLFKTDLYKNEIIHSVNLPSEVFGEGITILNDKIYQLTWRSSIGFVYNKETFDKLYEFSYPTEGWGLTNNGTELIMSDGSEKIYFLDTEFMQETRHLEVYDNKGLVTNLNELELINELIYANIYGSDEIVAFNINNGKVEKRINLKGILNKKDVKHPIDVLNGIAWDKVNKKLIITGKWWPKLFEIELVEK
ncbi:MAG: glutaminyl-peptide cyclotransferase [Salinivirgaceae bacterium]|nr:glutaminyl-peptide cyclotransferase [Salinivirgaceae bacterium]